MESLFSKAHVLAMPTDDFWIMFGILAALGIGGIGQFYLSIKHLRLMEDTPTSKLRSAALGYVELMGFTETIEDQPLRAALTHHPCVWYHYWIEEHKSSGKNSSWRVIEENKSTDFFKLNDRTSTCIIDPRGANVKTITKDQWYGNSRHPVGGRIQKSFFGIGSGRYRYTEKRVHLGEPLFVLGNLNTMGSVANTSQKKLIREVVNEWKADYDNLVAQFDSNGDGELDLDEWAKVREAAGKIADERRKEAAATPPTNILSKPPNRDYPYILSTRGQDELCRRYRWTAFGSILLGLPCGAYAAWMLAARLS